MTSISDAQLAEISRGLPADSRMTMRLAASLIECRAERDRLQDERDEMLISLREVCSSYSSAFIHLEAAQEKADAILRSANEE